MGADAIIYAVVDEYPEHLDYYDIHERFRIEKYKGGQGRAGKYQVEIEINNTNFRYFSPTYPRGDWPYLYRIIKALRIALPDCEVVYTSDMPYEVHYINSETEHELIPFWDAWLNKQLKEHTAAVRELKEGGLK